MQSLLSRLGLLYLSVVEERLGSFEKMCSYVSGSYEDTGSYENLSKYIQEKEKSNEKEGKRGPSQRLFYLAVPPNVFLSVSRGISAYLSAPHIATRLVVEKPFGRDLDSSNSLSKNISLLFSENEVKWPYVAFIQHI